MTSSELIASSGKQTITTTCCYCGVGCGVTATREGDRVTAVTGTPDHSANYGRLCVKGSSLHETQYNKDRLLQPLVNGIATPWNQALAHTAAEFNRIIASHGPDSVAFYLSGQLLTEDYYVANKLMKGFIGSANVDTNSRLCMASAVVAHKRAFGEDLVPGCYEDLEQTDLLLLVGSNMAYTHPVVYQRIVKAKAERPHMKVVVLDPRRTATCDLADIHLALRPGSDAFFFNGLLSYLADNNGLDQNFIDNHCEQFSATLAAARTQVDKPAQAARMCDLDESQLTAVYRLFAETDKAVTVFSQGINQSSSGVDKGNAIINCHLASGKIGKPGACPFSITGQPNAMGGREVGGLANQLAAHMNFGDEAALDRVARFWNAPDLAREEGLKAVDMFQAMHDRRVKAVWIMATNPVVTMPDADFIRQALEHCELVVVSDCVGDTDTAKLAHVVFPATTWGEKSGTVTNSERCMSVQKGFLPAPGEARNDWEIISQVATHMGFGDAFNYYSPADVFREHAALSGFENDGQRAFDISALANISDLEFFNLQPTFWPVNPERQGTRRLFTDGRFYTDSGRARFVPVTAQFPKQPPRNGEFIMNTGRIRDQWHTMSRTGTAAKLLAHQDEPTVDIHPLDATPLGVTDGDLVRLSNKVEYSRYYGRARLTTDVRRSEIFVPMHWNGRFAASSRADALVNAITDPLCGQPEFKHTPVKLEPFNTAWEGFLLGLEDNAPDSPYWVKIPLTEGYKFRLATHENNTDWRNWVRTRYPEVEQWSEMLDSSGQHYRAAGFIGDRFVLSLQVATNRQSLHENHWLESQLGQMCDSSGRFAVLAGVSAEGAKDEGKIVCSCFQVGEKAIDAALASGSCHDSKTLGEKLKCGTNCGSCIPELNERVRAHQRETEAAAS